MKLWFHKKKTGENIIIQYKNQLISKQTMIIQNRNLTWLKSYVFYLIPKLGDLMSLNFIFWKEHFITIISILYSFFMNYSSQCVPLLFIAFLHHNCIIVLLSKLWFIKKTGTNIMTQDSRRQSLLLSKHSKTNNDYTKQKLDMMGLYKFHLIPKLGDLMSLILIFWQEAQHYLHSLNDLPT